MKAKYVYCVINDNSYDIDDAFDDAQLAIELSLKGYDVAILDALSLEYYGSI